MIMEMKHRETIKQTASGASEAFRVHEPQHSIHVKMEHSPRVALGSKWLKF